MYTFSLKLPQEMKEKSKFAAEKHKKKVSPSAKRIKETFCCFDGHRLLSSSFTWKNLSIYE